MIFTNDIEFLKIFLNEIVDTSFKNFARNREKRDWTIVGKVVGISFFMNRNDVGHFPRGWKIRSTERFIVEPC